MIIVHRFHIEPTKEQEQSFFKPSPFAASYITLPWNRGKFATDKKVNHLPALHRRTNSQC